MGAPKVGTYTGPITKKCQTRLNFTALLREIEGEELEISPNKISVEEMLRRMGLNIRANLPAEASDVVVDLDETYGYAVLVSFNRPETIKEQEARFKRAQAKAKKAETARIKAELEARKQLEELRKNFPHLLE